MGARNVSAVFAMWADLAPLPKLLLVWMALKSLDVMSKEGKPPRLYYDGEESLIVASGRGRSQVYTALKVLRDRGAIEVLEAGRMKHRAVYKLRLNPLERSAAVSGNPDATVSGNPDALGSGNPDSRVRETGPLGGTKEGTEESRPGETSPPAVVSPASGPPVDNPEIEMSTEQANRELIKRQGLEHALRLLAQHATTHLDCENPAGHLLAGPSLTVIKGGRSA